MNSMSRVNYDNVYSDMHISGFLLHHTAFVVIVKIYLVQLNLLLVLLKYFSFSRMEKHRVLLQACGTDRYVVSHLPQFFLLFVSVNAIEIISIKYTL